MTFSQRAANPPLPRVPPPDRIYMYSLEIALRLAHIRKIHLYFSTHRSLSARCDLSRVSCIPPHPCAATCIAPNAPRGPHVSLYDHMHASANTYVDVIPQIYLYFLSPSRAQRRSHHPTTTRVPLTALWPRVRLRDGVPQQKCPYLFNAHRSHRRPPHGSRRPPTPPMRDPANPCTSRAEPWATTRAACATLSL